MKTVLLCAILFMTAFAYAVFWQDKLAELFAWKNVWKAVVGICAVAAVFLCRILLTRQERQNHPADEQIGRGRQ